MTANQFEDWLSEMKHRRYISNSAQAMALLGISKNTFGKYRKDGCSQTVGLACQALIMGFKAYGGTCN